MLTASAGLARDKGLRSAVRKHLRSGEDLLTSVARGGRAVRTVFTQMGGLMAERVTDLRDIERRVVAHLVGEPEPGVQMPDTPRSSRRGPRAVRHRDPRPAVVLALVTERGGPTSHTAIIARQLGIPCVVGAAGVMEIEAGTLLLVDGTTGTIDTAPEADEAARLVEEDRAAAGRLATWSGPGETADGTRIKILANVADGESARAAATGPVEGVGLFRTELCFLNRVDEPSAEEQAVDLRRGARALRRARTSSSAPSTRAPTSRSPSRPTRARRTPPSASAGCGCRSTTPACSPASSTASPGRPARPAPRPG